MNSGLWNMFETKSDMETMQQEGGSEKRLDNTLWAETPELEGLSDAEQIERISSFIDNMEEMRIGTWEGLSFNERLDALQNIENELARIEGRAPMIVESVNFPREVGGRMVWQEGKIQINESLVRGNTLTDLRQCTQTLLHEGRHAYQWHNIFVNRTEPSNERYESWVTNIVKVGYMDCSRFGYYLYSMQPVELDSRIFAEDATSKICFR